MLRDVAAPQALRYNPLNSVTDVVERVTAVDDGTAVHKRLRAPAVSTDSGSPWTASGGAGPPG